MEDLIMEQGYTAEPIAEPVKIDFLELARDAEAGSSSWFDSNVRNTMRSSLNQFYGRHEDNTYYNSEFFKARSKVFMPKTRSNIRKHESMAAAAYFSTMDVVQVSAFNDNDKNQSAAADFYKEVMNLRLTSSGKFAIPWFKILMGAYQDAMVQGVAIGFQSWNYALNKPDCTLVEPENFRFDPACNWVDPVNSSSYLIRKIQMTIGDIKEKIERGEFEEVSESELESARRPDNSGISQARNQGRVDPTQRSNSVKDFDLVWVNLNIIKQKGIDWVFYTLGAGDAYLTLPEPIENVFLHGQRPFVMGVCVIESHKNYPSSLPQMTRDLQALSNAVTNQRMDNMRQALDKRYIVRASARVDRDSITRNAPGSITLVGDIEKDVKVISTPEINQSAYKEQSMLDIGMDDLMGGFNSGTMQNNRSMNETVGGMTLISQGANQVAEYQLKTFNETWTEPVMQQILLLEQHYNTDKDFINLAGQNAKLVEKYGQVHLGDIKTQDVMLTCQVGMGATNPATRLEKFTMAMNAFAMAAPVAQQYGMDLKECSKEVFGALGYRDGSRFFNQEEDPQVKMLEEQIQQLQQELANKRNPAIDAAQADLLKAQAYKTRSEGTFGNIQSAHVISSMPAIAPSADQMARTNGFDDMQGDDPNFDQALPAGARPAQRQSIAGGLMNIASQDPDTLVAANEQSKMHKMRGNTDPLEPATGVTGMNDGIKGGQLQ